MQQNAMGGVAGKSTTQSPGNYITSGGKTYESEGSAGIARYGGDGQWHSEDGRVISPEYFSLFGIEQVGGWTGSDVAGLPNTGGRTRADLLQRLLSTSDTEQVNALVQSIQGLSTLPLADFFSNQFPGVVGDIGSVKDLYRNQMENEYQMPNVPEGQDFGAGTVYEEGQPGAQQMDALLKAAQDLGIPLANLQSLASTAAGELPANFDQLRGGLQAQSEEDWAERARQEESALAAAGISNSTQASEARNRRTAEQDRSRQLSALQEQQFLGGEQRANIQTLQDLLNTLYGQQLSGTAMGSGQIGQLAGLIGQGEDMDLARRQAETQRQSLQGADQQQQYQNLMSNLLTGENITSGRTQMALQPMIALLSALSGVNVAPTALPGLQMPRQSPSTGELLGGLAGSLIPNLRLPGMG